MVGHGTTGNGLDGYTSGSSSWVNKRYGFNIPEFFDCNDANMAVEGTGGWSSVLEDNGLFDAFDNFLTLKGIRLIAIH